MDRPIQRIAIVNEVSASEKNGDILRALSGRGMDVINAGMNSPAQTHPLSYLHTGLLTALLLNTGAADFVVGGCGTGIGYLMSASMYPGVFCGLAVDPLDGWLFTRINAGNCLSLPLNKGWGWGGDVNLKFLFDRLFEPEPGSGYPEHRKDPQADSRRQLREISAAAHMPMGKILLSLDQSLVAETLTFPGVKRLLSGAKTADAALMDAIDTAYRSIEEAE